MSSIKDLFEAVFSTLTSVGGYAAEHGGKAAASGVARKFGWASKKENTSGKPRMLGTGFGHGRDLNNYDPKSEYQQSQRAGYQQAMLSGSGVLKGSKFKKDPNSVRLHGRSEQIKSFGQRMEPQKAQGPTLKKNLKY